MKRSGALRHEMVFVTGIILLLVGLAVFMTLQAGTDDPPKDGEKEVTTSSGLKYIDLKVGTGDKVKVGTTVSVIYTGTFHNGEKFDSNVGKEAYPVTIGNGEVIRGWEEGLIGMQLGGKRKLIIPYKLAYGEKGKPPKIPAKTDLYFELEVVKVVQR